MQFVETVDYISLFLNLIYILNNDNASGSDCSLLYGMNG